MANFTHDASDRLAGIVLATGEAPLFRAENEEGAYGRNAGSKPPMAAPPARNSASASTTTPS